MAETKDYMRRDMENGTVNVSEEVIVTIALAAIHDVDGVVSIKNDRKGVRVSLGEDEIELDCGIVVLYGHSVVEIAKNVQNAVTNAVESMTGFKVSRVDVNVTGIAMAKQG